jgi:hypothetical protein
MQVFGECQILLAGIVICASQFEHMLDLAGELLVELFMPVAGNGSKSLILSDYCIILQYW